MKYFTMFRYKSDANGMILLIIIMRKIESTENQTKRLNYYPMWTDLEIKMHIVGWMLDEDRYKKRRIFMIWNLKKLTDSCKLDAQFLYLSSSEIPLNLNATGDIYKIPSLDWTIELKMGSIVGVSPIIHQEVSLECVLEGSNCFFQVERWWNWIRHII
jgi:hypothetical protein